MKNEKETVQAVLWLLKIFKMLSKVELKQKFFVHIFRMLSKGVLNDVENSFSAGPNSLFLRKAAFAMCRKTTIESVRNAILFS